MKRILSLLLCAALLAALLPTGALAAKRKKEAGPPVFRHHEFEHHYRLQEDSFEATDTEGGYRHYRCEDCGDEYSYHTDPMVYVTNPRTGELVDQAGAWNPLLPPWEHIPDPEPQVFWSRADGEWRCYLYGSHDDTGRGYCGFNYLLYSAPVYDLSDWRCEGVYLNGTDENGEVRLTSGELVFTEFPTYTYGNNHGGMARINGKWCFFGHRQTGRSAYSRQTLAGEVQLSVRDGVPVITPFEYSASGLAGSMPAYQPIPTYRASTLIPAVDHYAPSTENHNLHSDCLKTDPYITATRDEQAAHGTYIADLRDGSVAGFKYLDFGTEPAEPDLELLISSADSPTEAGVEVWLDAPCEEQGGVRLGVVHLTDSAVTGKTETGSDGIVWHWFRGGADVPVSGLHGVYFVFRTGAGSVGFDQFSFSR